MLKIWHFCIVLKIDLDDFFDILHMRGYNCTHIAENRMFDKILIPGAIDRKDLKIGVFSIAHKDLSEI